MNVVSNRAYHGGNQLWLNCQWFNDPRWCTYKQAKEKGWQVRSGERSTTRRVLAMAQDKPDDQGKMVEVKLDQPRVFYASVFNAQQIDGVPTFEAGQSPRGRRKKLRREFAGIRGSDILRQIGYGVLQRDHDQIHMPPR